MVKCYLCVLKQRGHKTAGKFSGDEIPKGVSVITAKWMFRSKTDTNGFITKAKVGLFACRSSQKFVVDFFETSAVTQAVTSLKLALAVAVQEGWQVYRFDATQALIRAKMDPHLFMKLREGCDPLTGNRVRLDTSIHGINEAGRQWPLVLNTTLMEDTGMSQSKADPCVYKQ